MVHVSTDNDPKIELILALLCARPENLKKYIDLPEKSEKRNAGDLYSQWHSCACFGDILLMLRRLTIHYWIKSIQFNSIDGLDVIQVQQSKKKFLFVCFFFWKN